MKKRKEKKPFSLSIPILIIIVVLLLFFLSIKEKFNPDKDILIFEYKGGLNECCRL